MGAHGGCSWGRRRSKGAWRRCVGAPRPPRLPLAEEHRAHPIPRRTCDPRACNQKDELPLRARRVPSDLTYTQDLAQAPTCRWEAPSGRHTITSHPPEQDHHTIRPLASVPHKSVEHTHLTTVLSSLHPQNTPPHTSCVSRPAGRIPPLGKAAGPSAAPNRGPQPRNRGCGSPCIHRHVLRYNTTTGWSDATEGTRDSLHRVQEIG